VTPVIAPRFAGRRSSAGSVAAPKSGLLKENHMQPHVLDRPVWSALATQHAALAEGGPMARRYDPTTVPFAAARDASPEALAALAALPRPGEDMALMEANPLTLPAGFVAVIAAPGVQMVLARTPERVGDPRIERLAEADAGEMLALATLTKPGPFTLRAQALGAFFGIRIGGRIAAMAGERMKMDGYTEVSGVCTHPDFRGQGLARLLSVFMTHHVLARGEAPFLHAWASNATAIRLYEQIGYTLRREMNVAMIRRAAEAAA
jgi:ribosomal protein S18 acetylase RimI-like enzyme